MCGIAASFGGQRTSHRDVVLRLLARIAHRGEADKQYELSEGNGYALGANRLAILSDPQEAQPRRSRDALLECVYNGEVYNYRQLFQNVVGGSEATIPDVDTDCLLETLRFGGADVIRLLDGMFALIWIDHRSGSAFAARDRLGIKPLFYAQTKHAFLLGSEIKALAPEDDVTQIEEVVPGTILTIRNGSGTVTSIITAKHYFDLGQSERRAVTAPQLRDSLSEAVRMECDYSRPIGVYLSGGVDSTGIYALARLASDNVVPLILSSESGSDGPVALRVVRELGGEPVVGVCPSEEALFADIEHTIEVCESFEPNVVRHSAIQMHIAHLAVSAGVKVVLCGEGADELFCGYSEFWESSQWLELRIQFLRDLHRTQLQRVDRCSMAVTTEVRVPYLSNDVVSLALAIKDRSQLFRDRANKLLLREALQGVVPEWVRWRPKIVLSEGAGLPGSHPTRGMFYRLAEGRMTESDYRDISAAYPEWQLETREEAFYFSVFQRLGFTKARFMSKRIRATRMSSLQNGELPTA